MLNEFGATSKNGKLWKEIISFELYWRGIKHSSSTKFCHYDSAMLQPISLFLIIHLEHETTTVLVGSFQCSGKTSDRNDTEIISTTFFFLVPTINLLDFRNQKNSNIGFDRLLAFLWMVRQKTWKSLSYFRWNNDIFLHFKMKCLGIVIIITCPIICIYTSPYLD